MEQLCRKPYSVVRTASGRNRQVTIPRGALAEDLTEVMVHWNSNVMLVCPMDCRVNEDMIAQAIKVPEK
jgi:hypothetical protein